MAGPYRGRRSERWVARERLRDRVPSCGTGAEIVGGKRISQHQPLERWTVDLSESALIERACEQPSEQPGCVPPFLWSGLRAVRPVVGRCDPSSERCDEPGGKEPRERLLLCLHALAPLRRPATAWETAFASHLFALSHSRGLHVPGCSWTLSPCAAAGASLLLFEP
jgi:hypothetical protein